MAAKLRRGFKKEAEELAVELRRELGLVEHAPIDIFALAEHLCIPTVPLSQMAEHATAESVTHFRDTEPAAFSGITIHNGFRRLILFNDAHADVRLNSTVAHELAHALLGHSASPLTNDLGQRNRDAEIEMEADWLAGAILIPMPAAKKIAFGSATLADAAGRYAVSESMLAYRLRVTGALTIAQRYRKKSC